MKEVFKLIVYKQTHKFADVSTTATTCKYTTQDSCRHDHLCKLLSTQTNNSIITIILKWSKFKYNVIILFSI